MLRTMRSTAASMASATTLLVALIACSSDSKAQTPTLGRSAIHPQIAQAPITRNEFDPIYTAWRRRIAQEPYIVIRSDTEAWTEVPEFWTLLGLGEPAVPFLLERLRQGDFHPVPVLETLLGLQSVRLYPNPMPPPGTFGLQDVAQLWLTPQAAQAVVDWCTYEFCDSGPEIPVDPECTAACARRGTYWREPPP